METKKKRVMGHLGKLGPGLNKIIPLSISRSLKNLFQFLLLISRILKFFLQKVKENDHVTQGFHS